MKKLTLYNTLSGKKEIFKPSLQGFVGLYTCGPTVYNFAHIGNLRTYIFEDILKRTLMLNGYKVKHIMNITDVGHLTSDADTGEDKLEKAAHETHTSAQDIARLYERVFLGDLKALNILLPNKMPRATEHIKPQIELIKKLQEKGFTYRTLDGIYFNTSKLKDYGKLARKNVTGIKAGARIEIAEKRNPTDFALWKFSLADSKREMEWNSPWGVGFPGWHIECSAMSMKYLGPTFDIHCGGMDHIQIHHSNEIAQSEAATGRAFVRYWLHGNFLTIQSEKMSRSSGNFTTLATLGEKGFSPLDFRYLALTVHWRKPMTFSWEALEAARTARREMNHFVAELKDAKTKRTQSKYATYKKYTDAFLTAVNDNLNVPKALSIVWKFIRDYRKLKTPDPKAALSCMLGFDHVLGLDLKNAAIATSIIPADIKKLAQKRESARKAKNWGAADAIRRELAQAGWSIEDTPQGPKIHPKP